jgi:hypothetical protein
MEEEIVPRLIMSRGNLNPGLENPNQPPVISIPEVVTAAIGIPVSLTALVTDDGLPKARVPKERPEVAVGTAQTNSTARTKTGLYVSWYQYRGPARVTFNSLEPIRVTDGKAVVTAQFSEPGTYILRASADDGELSTVADVTIHVTR